MHRCRALEGVARQGFLVQFEMMDFRGGLPRRSMEERSEDLRSRTRTSSSSMDMDADFRNGLNDEGVPKSGAWTSRSEERSAQRIGHTASEEQDWGPAFEGPRSTSPLNDDRLPSARLAGQSSNSMIGSTGDAKSEVSSTNGASAGLLRLSGRHGWTASSWQAGSAKSQATLPDKVGSVHFPGQSSGSHDNQQQHSAFAMPSTPRSGVKKLESASTDGKMEENKSGIHSSQANLESRHEPGGANANLSKEWINMELERLRSEYQFKSQIATMLRSTLSGMKTQQPAPTLPSGSTGWPALVPQHQKLMQPEFGIPGPEMAQGTRWSSPMAGTSLGDLEAMKSEAQERKKNISHLESDIAALEAHVKLLSDALDDERQDNQDLTEENMVLRAQVEKLTTAGEKLLKGMTMMRGTQE